MSASAGNVISRKLWGQSEGLCFNETGSTKAEKERRKEIWCFLFSSSEQMYFDISTENCYWFPSQSAMENGPTFSSFFFFNEMGQGI